MGLNLVPSRTDGTICLDVDGVRGRAKRLAMLPKIRLPPLSLNSQSWLSAAAALRLAKNISFHLRRLCVSCVRKLHACSNPPVRQQRNSQRFHPSVERWRRLSRQRLRRTAWARVGGLVVFGGQLHWWWLNLARSGMRFRIQIHLPGPISMLPFVCRAESCSKGCRKGFGGSRWD